MTEKTQNEVQHGGSTQLLTSYLEGERAQSLKMNPRLQLTKKILLSKQTFWSSFIKAWTLCQHSETPIFRPKI